MAVQKNKFGFLQVLVEHMQSDWPRIVGGGGGVVLGGEGGQQGAADAGEQSRGHSPRGLGALPELGEACCLGIPESSVPRGS